MAEAVIAAEGLGKRFGPLLAVDGVDLQLPAGGVLGLLGPNGAGKTTTVRILATLLKPDRGRARVAGFDVARQPQQVRRRIGLSGQFAAADSFLTGRENLVMIGRLYGLTRQQARQRADDLIGQLDLSSAAGRLARTYAGGMRRRLDAAAAFGAAAALGAPAAMTGLLATAAILTLAHSAMAGRATPAMFQIGRAGDDPAALAPLLTRFANWSAARAVGQTATLIVVAITVAIGT